MALASVFAPAPLLVLAAALSWGLGLAGREAGRVVAATAAWLALATLGAAWFSAGRSLIEATTTIAPGVSPLRLRADAVTVIFLVAVLAPTALLMTFQRRSSREAAVASLAAAAALICLQGGSLLWTAAGLALCTTLVLIQLDLEEPRLQVSFWIARSAAWLLLIWTAVLLEANGGTSVYGAIPVTALRPPIFAVMIAAAILCSGLWPWRGWVSKMWTRHRLEAGTLAVALVVPLGFYPLVRAYGMGAGQWPSTQAGVAMAGLGAAVALGAAVRAQAAATRQGYVAEALTLASGLTLVGLGLGTPLGLVAALTGLLGMSAVAGLAPLLSSHRGWVEVLAIATLAGAPPAIVFGGWLISFQAALEAGIVTAFIGLAGAAAWLLSLAAAARAILLPPAPRGYPPAGSRPGSVIASSVAVAAGVALTALLALLAIPAAAEVMPPGPLRGVGAAGVSQAGILGAGSLVVSTASGGWSAALLAGPLMLLSLGVAGAALALRKRAPSLAPVEVPPPARVRRAPPPPIFVPPLAGFTKRATSWLETLRLPEQYQSLFRPSQIEFAVTRTGPWLWVAATIVLTVAVTR